MVNAQLFQTAKGALLPQATARNHALAPAYEFGPRHQLAQRRWQYATSRCWPRCLAA